MTLKTEKQRDQHNLTISTKRQVTLPAAVVRQLGLHPGDKLVARVRAGTIVLKRRPKSLVEYLNSFPPDIYGKTKEEIDANLAEGRRDRPVPGLEEAQSENR